MISVQVHGVGRNPSNQGFVALLLEEGSNRWLPIHIGSFEAQAIAMELDEDVEPPRPMTHDLTAHIIRDLEAEVKKVVVSQLKDNTYYAEITLQPANAHNEIVLDARPSDSIALALRTGADIYVADQVMDEASVPAQSIESDLEESEDVKSMKLLQKRLQRAVEAEDFEKAAQIRDKIQDIQSRMREEEESLELEEDVEEELRREFEDLPEESAPEEEAEDEGDSTET